MQGHFLLTQWALYFYRSYKDNLLAWWWTLFCVSLLFNNSSFTSHWWILFLPVPKSSISLLFLPYGCFRFWVDCWHVTWGKHFLFTWHRVKYVFKGGFRWFPNLNFILVELSWMLVLCYLLIVNHHVVLLIVSRSLTSNNEMKSTNNIVNKNVLWWWFILIFSVSWNCCWFCVILYVLSSFFHVVELQTGVFVICPFPWSMFELVVRFGGFFS